MPPDTLHMSRRMTYDAPAGQGGRDGSERLTAVHRGHRRAMGEPPPSAGTGEAPRRRRDRVSRRPAKSDDGRADAALQPAGARAPVGPGRAGVLDVPYVA